MCLGFEWRFEWRLPPHALMSICCIPRFNDEFLRVILAEEVSIDLCLWSSAGETRGSVLLESSIYEYTRLVLLTGRITNHCDDCVAFGWDSFPQTLSVIGTSSANFVPKAAKVKEWRSGQSQPSSKLIAPPSEKRIRVRAVAAVAPCMMASTASTRMDS